MKNLFIVTNLDSFFLSHRRDIAKKAIEEGFRVTVVAKDTGKSEEITALGAYFINLPINKTGTDLKEELRTFYFLYRLYKKESPDIVHHVGLKIILWGSLAAKLARVPGELNAISGLGIMFSDERRNSLMSKTVLRLLKFTHNRKNLIALFQNNEDKALFLSEGIVKEEICEMTNGSGVDLNTFRFMSAPTSEKLKVLFTARMVEDKGVLVLIEAAKQLRDKYKDKVEFLLCGGLDTNPNGITADRLKNLCDGEYIQWLGHCTNVLELLQRSHVVAFPSWYREGIPRSLIEATAVGRPIITTNSIGCKETVIDGFNGYLVPIRNSDVIAEKLYILFDDEALRLEMGRNSRKLAEEKFSITDVIDKHIDIYIKLLAK